MHPSLLISFCLNSILSDIVVLYFLSSWVHLLGIFFLFFYLRVMFIFMVRCISWMHQRDGVCLQIQSVSLCIFISKLRRLILGVINNKQSLLFFLILILCCWLFPSSFDLLFWDYLFLVFSLCSSHSPQAGFPNSTS